MQTVIPMRIITFIVTILVAFASFAQRIDRNGNKMVSEIVHENYNNHGECYDQTTFKFTYNANGEMTKIAVNRCTGIGDIFKRNKKPFLFAVITMNSNAMSYDEYEEGVKINYRKHKFTLSSDGKRLINDIITTSDGKHVTRTYEYEGGVFSGLTEHYRGDFEIWHLIFDVAEGNYYPIGKDGFVYSDEVNDTNINLDCLTWRVFGPIMVNEREHILLTQKVPLKSRNVIKEFMPDKASGKMICDVERDEKGNITNIHTKYTDGSIARKELRIKYLF